MVDGKHIAAVLVAAGRSSRMGFDKLFFRVRGREILLHALGKLDDNPLIDSLVVVAGENIEKVEALLAKHPPQKTCRVVQGGATRAESAARGVAACDGADVVVVHDAARPYVSQSLISRVVKAGAETGAAAPSVPVQDTIKTTKDGLVAGTPPRQSLAAVQTPQVFNRQMYLNAFDSIPEKDYLNITDDCMVMERAGHPVSLVEGEFSNRKITVQEDLEEVNTAKHTRIGNGYDVHKLVTGRKLVLGGVTIPHPKGLLGHSDADVLVHAMMDAMLGAAALGDIGAHFPDSDPAYKDVSSIELLGKCKALLLEEGYKVHNIDAIIVCEAPKLAPRMLAMRRNVARELDLELTQVSIKATTEEGLGFSGRGEGISSHCVVSVLEY